MLNIVGSLFGFGKKALTKEAINEVKTHLGITDYKAYKGDVEDLKTYIAKLEQDISQIQARLIDIEKEVNTLPIKEDLNQLQKHLIEIIKMTSGGK